MRARNEWRPAANRDRGTARRIAAPRAPVLRPRHAGDQRRRVRCADAAPAELEHRPSRVRPRFAHAARGRSAARGFVKQRHSTAMLSLDNALNEGELRDFDRRVRELLAGEAVRSTRPNSSSTGCRWHCVTRQGLLQLAVTRGDGLEGEDVTENARTIRSVPLRTERGGRVRGPRRGGHAAGGFRKLNEERARGGPAAVRQSPEFRGRVAARAGPRDHRRADARFLRLLSAGGRPPAARFALGMPGSA
jgi:hypothetical protein